VIVLSEPHLRYIPRAYLVYDHRSRTQFVLGKDAPDGRPADSGGGKIVVTPEAGGLHHRLIVMRYKRDSPDFRPACDHTEAIDANVAVAAVAEDLATRARSHSLRTLYEPWEPGGL
jgi:hypothetical protein